MQTKLKLLNGALLLACSSFSCQSLAVLAPHAKLNFTACALTGGSSPQCLQTGGSWFAMDQTGEGKITAGERTSLSSHNGIYISTAQAASGSHGGAPYAVDLIPPENTELNLTTIECEGTEQCGLDKPWSFFNATGLDFTAATNPANILSASGANATVDFSGWRVTWNGIASINMGTNAWQPVSGATPGPYSNGIAIITCAVDCATGDTYALNYAATVPVGDPSGFGGVKYFVHLEGTIGTYNTAPVATSSFTIPLLVNTTLIVDLTDYVTDDYGLVVTSVLLPVDNSCDGIANNNDGTITLPACAASDYTFTYTIADTDGVVSNTGTITVNVTADPVPLTGSDFANTDGSSPIIIPVAANDTDAAPGTLDFTSVAIVDAPAHGSTSINSTNGDITYTADDGFAGTDSFTYTINDNTAQTSAATPVTVTVNAFNVPSASNTLTPGTVAVAASSNTGIVTYANIGVEDNGDSAEQGIAESCIGGCFDFVVSDLTPGDTALIVLPLSTAIPATTTGDNIQYRKVISGVWTPFVTDADPNGNNLASAAGTVLDTDVTCPIPGSTSYTSGLTAGDRCLQLSIVDGGPNDADGTADGFVTDPGGLTHLTTIDTRVSGTESGCSMTGNSSNAADHADWLLLAGFMTMLGWFGMKRRKA